MAITTGILTGGTNNHPTTSEDANGIATDFVNEGVVGNIANTNGVAPATGGFAVNAQGTPAMSVAVSIGVAYVSAIPTSQASQTLRVQDTALSNVVISANVTGSTRFDWLYISISSTNAANPNTAADNVATLVTSRSSSASSDDGSPPTFGYPLAVITVANGATSITNGNIRDIRNKIILETGSTASASGWSALGFTPTTVTNNGNRSYDLVFSTTQAATLSPGMRIRAARTVAAPTQCTSLNGTTQYYNDTTVAGMTFTDDFTVSAWVKLSSYPTVDTGLTSRFNGTSGWIMFVAPSGQISLAGYNGGAGNSSRVSSFQSIPLNKWVHITAQLDMSAFTATTTTSYVMIDGVDVPASVARTGTNPTALIQAGNLEIGSFNASAFFPGKLAQVWINNAKVTQATVRTYMSQGVAGNESGMISAYSFNNTINDLNTTNANNLTAQAGAVATNADSPFATDANGVAGGTNEFGIVTRVATTTVTIRVPEGCAIPTSGGVGSIDYATVATPFGFPQISNVIGEARLCSTATQASNTLTDVSGLSVTCFIPQGRSVKLSCHGAGTNSVANNGGSMGIRDTTSSVDLVRGSGVNGASGDIFSMDAFIIYTPPTFGLRTFQGQLARGSNASTVTLQGSVVNPALVIVELV